jgi:hypothetical protein
MAENRNSLVSTGENLSYGFFLHIHETVYRIHEKVQLSAHVNQALLWMNAAENHNCAKIFSEVCHTEF